MSSQATQDQATKDAWAAGAWSFGSAVKTPAQASVAARWAFLEASKEAKEGSRFGPTYYASIASSAALDYYGGSVGDILARVAAKLSDVPYTSGRWATVRGLSTLAAVVSPPKPAQTSYKVPAKTNAAGGSTALTAPTSEAPVTGWLGRVGSWFGSLPWWAMPFGAVVVLGGVILFVRRPKASP